MQGPHSPIEAYGVADDHVNLMHIKGGVDIRGVPHGNSLKSYRCPAPRFTFPSLWAGLTATARERYIAAKVDGGTQGSRSSGGYGLPPRRLSGLSERLRRILASKIDQGKVSL
jgi:hypothetical protein